MTLPYSQIPPKALKVPSPFKSSVPEDQIWEFKQLLKLSKIPEPTYESLQEDGRFGVSHKWLTNAKNKWAEFDWRKSEKYINSFPNFKANVTIGNEQHSIHFVALFSEQADAIPLVLLHGWPGNFLEFLPLLSLLKKKYPTPQLLPYHIIVPSLPGYAFSSPPPLTRNFDKEDIAEVTNQLLLDLGFGPENGGYIAQGGDVGSYVAKSLGAQYEGCKAVHVNFFPIRSPPENIPSSTLTPRDEQGLKRREDFLTTGAAYAIEHASRPSTIGLVLASNPLALLAWIGEKFLAWSDENPSLHTILESVTLYWFTESFPRGIYPYRGRFEPVPKWQTEFFKKPLGFSNFPKEVTPTPKSWVEIEANLVFYREHVKGGHFAALEQPELLLGDLEDFVKQVWVK